MKKKKNSFREFDEDVYHENGFHDKLREHRQEKRLKNAIRSKNIADLLHLDDDDL